MKFSYRVGSGVALAFLLMSTAPAHHSGAMFDITREVEIAGTVHEFQWTNPHVFIELMVDSANGPQKYVIESPTPGVLRAHGWKFNSLKPGDKVVARVHPLREGRVGGYLVSLAKDGVPLGDGAVSPGSIQGYK